MEIKEDITVPEIKAELETLGITFDNKLKKPELYELLVKTREEAVKPTAPQEETHEPEHEDASTGDHSHDTTNHYYDVVVKCPKLQVRSEPRIADDTKRYVVLEGGILTAITNWSDSEWTTLADGCYVKSEFVEIV